jgi:hypothetical protein
MVEKCKTCGDVYTPACDYNQGRCPHHPSALDQILLDNYKARYYNLFNSIKNWFKK